MVLNAGMVMDGRLVSILHEGLGSVSEAVQGRSAIAVEEKLERLAEWLRVASCFLDLAD